MKVSPSFDLTQKIGTLTSGKQSFDESLRQHEKAFEMTVNKSYSHLRESANRHINNSIENVKEIDEAKKTLKRHLTRY
ncbi:hypothetical protein ACODGR_11550 [Vagococcus fluvialis]|uniref:hypothetical protein n=1 Tax=Vagococcus fluvialis TaxID=2738 RepID=UPI003B221D9C